MNNAYIITSEGVVVTVSGRPYSADNTHINYAEIVQAIKDEDFDIIPDLVNASRKIAEYVASESNSNSSIAVDVEAGVVTYDGEELHGTIVTRILDMCADGFDISPMIKFLENLVSNPSHRALNELYGFLEYGSMPITEDGCFLAYKRINNDYTDCHSGKVVNQPAELMSSEQRFALDNGIKAGHVTTTIEDGLTTVSMLRAFVNDNSEQTCSDGLHFCSHEYLNSFGGSRVVVLKINPRDVVSIPVDYNNTKGRCCRYQVLEELAPEVVQRAESEGTLNAPVVTSNTNLNASSDYVRGYINGYKDGKDKDAYDYSDEIDNPDEHDEEDLNYYVGYMAGAKAGRGHKPKLYK